MPIQPEHEPRRGERDASLLHLETDGYLRELVEAPIGAVAETTRVLARFELEARGVHLHPDAELQAHYDRNAAGHAADCRRRVVPTLVSDSRVLDVERCGRCRELAGRAGFPS